MFRCESATSRPNNDFEQDDNYEFTGATLKISSIEKYENATTGVISNDNDNKYENTVNSSRNESRMLPNSNSNTAVENPKIGSPGHFFSFRSGQFEKAVDDIVNILLRPMNDVNILGKWLLTEISHWDHERERVFILTTRTLLVVKYDFIALRILTHNKIRLTQVDTIVRGKLTYPGSSLVPRIEGITNGVTSIIQRNVFTQEKESKSNPNATSANNLALINRFDFTQFKPIERHDIGIRIMWNRGQPISFITSWNPFATDVPWITFKDHPLFSYNDRFNSPSIQENLDKNRQIYSADNLYEILMKIFSCDNDNDNAEGAEVNYSCIFLDEPIMMQNYIGIGAVIHNKNNFGFFKVRGKFSF